MSRLEPDSVTRDRLTVMAWIEALELRFHHLPARARPFILRDSTRESRSQMRCRHRRLYRLYLGWARAVLSALSSRSDSRIEFKVPLGLAKAPPRAVRTMWRVARDVASASASMVGALGKERKVRANFFSHARTRYPLVWDEILNCVGLGWSGQKTAAPRSLLTRARLRRAARMFAIGLSMSYASRQMGLGTNAIDQARKAYPQYWEALCVEARSDLGLLPGQYMVARLFDANGRIIARVSHGRGRVARAKLRLAAGVKRAMPEALRAAFERRFRTDKVEAGAAGPGGRGTEQPPPAQDAPRVDTPVSLKEFMMLWCTPLRESLLKSRVAMLNKAAFRKTITLPEYEGRWRSGQTKRWRPTVLYKAWAALRRILPGLPELNPLSRSS